MWCFSFEFDQVNSLPVDCTGCGWAARHRYPGWVEGVWGRHTHPVHFSPCHTRTFDQPVWEQLPKTEKNNCMRLWNAGHIKEDKDAAVHTRLTQTLLQQIWGLRGHRGNRGHPFVCLFTFCLTLRGLCRPRAPGKRKQATTPYLYNAWDIIPITTQTQMSCSGCRTPSQGL